VKELAETCSRAVRRIGREDRVSPGRQLRDRDIQKKEK